jgi:hypothetical protein
VVFLSAWLVLSFFAGWWGYGYLWKDYETIKVRQEVEHFMNQEQTFNDGPQVGPFLLEKKPMAEVSPHLKCTAHSGLSQRVNLLIALMSVATVLLGVVLKNVVDIKGSVLVEVAKIEGRVNSLEIRMYNLEKEVKR